MRVGVVFPQTEIGDDPIKIRDFAQAAEQLGYDHLAAFDHVLGADADRPGGWSGPYSHRDAFYEPLVLFAFLAQATRRLEFVTGVLVLPQRQTALVAKQAATLDVLSGGRLRLGVGIGWNEIEYIGLDAPFRNRASRIVEQMAVLRRLWTEPVVDYAGRWHHIPRAGINPLPIQRPIPLWMGAGRHGQPPPETALRRIATHADGWMSHIHADEAGWQTLSQFRQFCMEAGRDPDHVGVEVRVRAAEGDPDHWARTAEAFARWPISHLGLNTMNAGLTTPDAHIEAIQRFREMAPIFTHARSN
jgi:probable F420-dependent oxidoreductase